MVDYKQALESLGYKLSDHGAYWRTSALYRSGNNSSALQIYKDSGVWKDFVEDSMFLPFKVLVEKTLNTKDNTLISQFLKAESSLEIQTKKRHLLKEEKTYKDNCLSRLLPHYDFYLNRGVSQETLQDFRCGLAMSGKLYQRLVFPIVRDDGKIHGFSGRKVIESDDRPKWLHSGRCSSWFFPYFAAAKTKEAIEKTGEVHIVESIGDCLSLYDSGVCNVLVSFGLSLSPKFIANLANLSVDKIFISLNNDFDKPENRGFQGAAKSILKLNESLDFEKIYFAPPSENDFGSMGKDGVKNHMDRINSDSFSHKKTCEAVINIAEGMCKSKKVPKTFHASLNKYKKKYEFHYEDI